MDRINGPPLFFPNFQFVQILDYKNDGWKNKSFENVIVFYTSTRYMMSLTKLQKKKEKKNVKENVLNNGYFLICHELPLLNAFALIGRGFEWSPGGMLYHSSTTAVSHSSKFAGIWIPTWFGFGRTLRLSWSQTCSIVFKSGLLSGHTMCSIPQPQAGSQQQFMFCRGWHYHPLTRIPRRCKQQITLQVLRLCLLSTFETLKTFPAQLLK